MHKLSGKFRKTRYDRIIIGILIVVFLYGLIGFFVVPPVAKKIAVGKLSEAIGRQVTIRKIEVNPFAFSVRVLDISVMDKDSEVFTSFGEIYVNFETVSVFKRALVFKKLLIDKPYFRAVIDEDGVYNFSDLMASEESVSTGEAEIVTPEAEVATSEENIEEKSPPLNVIIYSMTISGGKVAYTDLSLGRTFETNLRQLRLTIQDFAIVSDGKSTYRIFTETEADERIDIEGAFTAYPPSVETSVKLINIKLPKYTPYMHDSVGFDLSDGTLNLKFDFQYKSDPAGDILKVDNGYFGLESLQLDDRDSGEKFLAIPELALNGILLDLAGRRFSLEEFTTNAGYLLVRLSKTGRLNLERLFSPPASAEEQSPAPAPVKEKKDRTEEGQPWKVLVRRFAIDDYAVRFEDHAPSTPFVAAMDKIDFETVNIAVPTSPEPNTIEFSTRFNQTGSMAATGEISIDPLAVGMKIKIADIALDALQPYVSDNLSLSITGGEFNTDGAFSLTQSAGGQPSVSYKGKVSVVNLATVEKVTAKDFLKWRELSLPEIAVSYNPTAVDIKEISLKGLYARVALKSNGKTNIDDVLAPPRHSTPVEPDGGEGPEEAAVEPEPAPEEPPPPEQDEGAQEAGEEQAPSLKIGPLNFADGTFEFTDGSIRPAYKASLTDINGTISGLLPEGNEKTAINIKCKLGKYSPMKIKGKFSLADYKKYLNMNIDFKNIGLSDFTPYSGKYLGYRIGRGKLSLKLKYKINNKQLKADNYIYMNQFTFGQKVNSEDAVKLPVKLAVSLMKDRKGVIELDLPVGGDLGNPKVNVWKLILQALKNLITKLAAAPFSALGSLVGGGGEEMGYVDFEYGKSEINDEQKLKLDTLAKALGQRPDIALEIHGGADSYEDAEILKHEKLMRLLVEVKRKELVAAGETDISTPEVVIEPMEYETYLRAAYAEAGFPKPKAVEVEQKPGQAGEEDITVSNIENLSENLDLDPPKNAVIPTIGAESPVELLPAVVIEQLLLEHIGLTEEELKALAVTRAEGVRDYLVENGMLSPDMIFMADPDISTRESEKEPPKNRVNFTLN